MRRSSLMMSKILAHEQRREAQRWLVQENEPRRGHQPARYRQHLLLATAQPPEGQMLALAQDRKLLKVLLCLRAQALLAAGAAAAIAAEQQVVHHGLVGEQAAALGHQHHAGGNDAVGRLGSEFLAVETNAALHRTQDAASALRHVLLPAPLLPISATSSPSARGG